MSLNCTTLVLDLDGTISDPSIGIVRSINHALLSQGFRESREKAIAREIGAPLDEIFETLDPDVTSEHIPKLVEVYRKRYADIGYQENTIYPGMVEMLDNLRDAGIQLGICTSKRRDFAVKIAALFKLSGYFSFISGGDIGISKQQQLAELLERGSIDTQAVMVGDRAVDIISAQQNGLNTIGVLWGFGGYQELSTASPYCIVSKIEELQNCII